MGKTIRKKFTVVIMTLAMVVSLLPAVTLPASATITNVVYTWTTYINEELNGKEEATYYDTANGLTITYTNTYADATLRSTGGWLELFSYNPTASTSSLTLEKTDGTLFSPDPVSVMAKRDSSGSFMMTISSYGSDGTRIASCQLRVGTETEDTHLAFEPADNVKKIKFEFDGTFSITDLTLGTANAAPTDISLSNSSVAENTASGLRSGR